MYFETITYERNERFCPIIRKNVLMDVNEKSCNGCTITKVKCCNEKQCSIRLGKCMNKLLQEI
ncbi:hypothetical protein [Petroclostridium sp. X23]|uniref:hypothetical protein n=1 Tax=Petroclostridium sp. X23 TaxID=3045146 RepID=UPI0024ACE793|nr:hypothetical protein [Petroclostridium sp. X23]WHH57107.1 hypothetical protein QKW49_14795 [Petroclostridium sp. X23]